MHRLTCHGRVPEKQFQDLTGESFFRDWHPFRLVLLRDILTDILFCVLLWIGDTHGRCLCMTASELLVWIFNIGQVKLCKWLPSWKGEAEIRSEPNVFWKTSQEITGVGRTSDCDYWCFVCPALHTRRVGLNLDIRRLHNFRNKFLSMRALK